MGYCVSPVCLPSTRRSSHQVTAAIHLSQVSGCGEGVVVGGVNR